MKRPILGFIIGGLWASIWPNFALLLSPLILVWVVICYRQWVYGVIAMVLAVAWINYHWYQVNSQALAEEAGKIQQVMQGSVGFVSKQRAKTEFDFYPDSQFDQLKVSCYRCPFDIETGERWQLDLRLKPIHSFQNPQGFDYRGWLLAKGYAAQAYVYLQSTQNKQLRGSALPSLNHLSRLLNTVDFPILRALVLGDKNGLSAADKRLIFSSGISHLFVVSGLHVGIVAAIIGGLFYWLQRPLLLFNWLYTKEVAVVLGIGSAVVYGFITGYQVPAVRAVLMLVCGAVMLFQSRYTHVIHYFTFALIMVLVFNPLAFMGMGSWLSFSIVLALILGFAGATRLSWLPALIKAQWLAFCMGGLILLGFSQALVPFSFFLNLLLIPFFTLLVMPCVMLVMIWAELINLDGLRFLEYGLERLLGVLHGMEPFLSWYLPVHDDNRWLVMFALVLSMLPKALHLRGLGIVLFVSALMLPLALPKDGGFQLTVFDVGQGNAALIQTSNHNVVVDTGARFMNGLTLVDLVVQPFLQQHVIRSLDMLHLTHADNDHAGGEALLAGISAVVVKQSVCANEHWLWDDVLFERFQAPNFKQGNDGSCILRVTSSNGQSVLFTGDIEQAAEQELVASMAEKLRADVLIAPHHGSRTSSSGRFIDAVNAKMVIISAGFLNHYGHPHEQTLLKYRQRNMTVYTTAHDGAVQVVFPPRQEALVVSTYRPNFALIE